MLVLGTRNAKKAGELQVLLAPYDVELKTLADFPEAIEVVEDGTSFADNAQLKAQKQALHLQRWVIGEDSGLCVDALDGAPGIYSARYSGPNATDAANNEYLLEQLQDIPLPQRTAHYVCHITLSDPDGQIHADCEATCQGRVRFQPAGRAGFGYDPLFEIVEYHRTFGELGDAVKSLLSHRARAMRRFVPQVARLLQNFRL
jgi:XTP/dITP diphosphohydrolase